MRGDDERIYPPGVVPGAVGALGLIAAAVLVFGLAFGWILGSCDRTEPTQMVPDAPQAVISTASAQVFASQSVRVTVKRAPTASQRPTSQDAQEGPLLARQVSQHPAIRAVEADRGDEIVIEVSQAIGSGATSSAAASAISCPQSVDNSHGHLGVIVATMPGILAADLQLLRLDVSPVTRWLVDVDMEVGVDTIINLEAIGSGVTVGGKSFVGIYGWNRWNMSGQGVAVGVGLRF